MSEANKSTPGTDMVPTPRSAPSPTPRRGLLWLGLILILLLVVAVAAGGGLLWQQVQRLTVLNNNLQQLSAQLQQLQTSTASKEQLDTALENSRQQLKTFSDRLDSMDATLNDLRRRSEEGRDAWIRAEAASLLEAANEQVQINANPALALKALAAADGRLKLLSNPRLIPVRQKIAKEETALHAVPQVDLQGMALSLSSLSAAVDSLPLKRVAPEHYEPAHTAAAASIHHTLWQRLKISVTNMFAALFTVRHRTTRVEPLLPPNQEFFLRRNLELRLTAARVALINRDGKAFNNSVRTAHEWLATYFNVQAPGVKAALAELARMQAQQINPPLPDISGSLALLRKLDSSQGKAP